MNKTRYRSMSDGHTKFLQYQKVYTFWIFKIKVWKYIRRPYIGELDILGYDSLVCEYNTNFDKFIKDWKKIEDYFRWLEFEQWKLEEKSRQEEIEFQNRKSTIKYYD